MECRMNFIRFASVTYKGVTFKLAKRPHLDSHAHDQTPIASRLSDNTYGKNKQFK